jgi:tRNA nucleotidyltransferase (CCA-adding enzyme)
MKIFLVGGAVRDQLLKKYYKNKIKIIHHEKDWVVIGSSPEAMINLGFKPVGKDFPVFLHPQTHEEYALARTERKTAKGYAGFVFHTSPHIKLEEDLKRRDLTINAIAMSEEGEIIDPYHGEQDLKLKVLRHVSKAFCEDPVRILRIARFMTRFSSLHFTIAPETHHLMEKMVKLGEVDALGRERVWQETRKALGEKSAETFFQVLENCGALKKLYPSLHQLDFTKIKLPFQNGLLNFAKLSLKLSREDIQFLCKHAAVPAEYKELALLANKFQHEFNQIKLTSLQLLKLLEQSDAYRRKNRFNQLLTLFKQKKSSGLLEKALKLTQSISTEHLIQKGYSGKQLGEKIQQTRLERLIKHFGE